MNEKLGKNDGANNAQNIITNESMNSGIPDQNKSTKNIKVEKKAPSTHERLDEAAKKYIRRGLKVIPIVANSKRPATLDGCKSASGDNAVINGWFLNNTSSNIAIATGIASGVWVLDIDIKNDIDGEASLNELIEKYGALPETLTSITQSGGKHFYFKCPAGINIKNRVAIAPGIDVRGDGGFCIASPSVIDKKYYYWVNEHAEIADSPDWLIHFVTASKLRKKAMTQQGEVVAAIPAGSRNDQMFQLIMRLLHSGTTKDSVTTMALMSNETMCNPPLEEAEVNKIVESAFKNYSNQVHFHTTDIGNARRMAKMHRHHIRFVVDADTWLHWNGNAWEKVDRTYILQLGKQTVDAMHIEADQMVAGALKDKLKSNAYATEKSREFNSMVKLFESEEGIPVSINQLDAGELVLPVKNGMIDLKTGELLPANKDLLITRFTDIEFDATAGCPTWSKFMSDITQNDPLLVRYLQRMVGYSLTKSTTEQCIFFMYGYGANGKSTFLNILLALVGALGTQAGSEFIVQGTKRNSQAASGDLARLNGMRFVAISEIDDGRHLEEAIVKSLTGGDPITARFLYKSEFVFTPVAKFWIATNHKPTIRGNDHGIWRRVRLIPFSQKFDKSQQDPNMESKLRRELPGILNWAIAGCLDWQGVKMPLPPVIEKATNEYRSEMDILGNWLEQNCMWGSEFEISFAEAYDDFSDWMTENYNISYAKKRLGQLLIERGFERGPQSNKRTYRGFDLKKNHDALSIVEYEVKQAKLRGEINTSRMVMAKLMAAFSGITWNADDSLHIECEQELNAMRYPRHRLLYT